MKKLMKVLSVFLAITMIIPTNVIPFMFTANSADASNIQVEILTAEQFAAMEAGGNYKLGADITITESYGDGDTVTTFTGTLDGNGHTVTIAAPMFVQFCGTIKNLTIEGSASKDGTTNALASFCGAIANAVPKNCGTAVFENVTNNAAISGKYRIGGFIGQISSGNIVKFNNCVNNGTILGGNMVGGFVAYSQDNTITFTNCVNNGKVSINTADGLSGLAGGLIGRFGADTKYAADSHADLVIDNCLNTAAVEGTSQAAGILAHGRHADITIKNTTNKGKITAVYYVNSEGKNAGGSDAAGIFGTTASSDGYYCMLYIDKCVNEGDVEAYANRAGGIAVYVWCGGNNGCYMHAEITNCVNKGKVTGGSFVSQFLAYTNDANDAGEGNKQSTKIQGVGLGSLARSANTTRTEDKTYFAIVGLSSSAKGANYDYNLTLADSDKSNWVAYSEGTEANRITIADRPDTIRIVSEEEAIEAANAVLWKRENNHYPELYHFSSNNDGTCTFDELYEDFGLKLMLPRVSPEGDTVTAVGKDAFGIDYSIEALLIPREITTIEAGALSGMKKLERIYYEGSEEAWLNVSSELTPEELEGKLIVPGSFGLEFEQYDTTCALMGVGTCTDTDIIVPAYDIDGRQVVCVGGSENPAAADSYAFNADFLQFDRVFYERLPENISVDDPEFEEYLEQYKSVFNSIRSITLPDTVFEIKYFSFVGMKNLEEVVLNEGLEVINSGSFYNCPKLKKLHFPSTLVSFEGGMGGDIPFGDLRIDFTVAPGNPRYFEKNGCVFERYRELYIEDFDEEYLELFLERTGCTILPDGPGMKVVDPSKGWVITDENMARKNSPVLLSGCDNAVIPDDIGLYRIEPFAFYGRTGIDNIKIPDTVEEIGAFAFSNSDLKTVQIPDSVKYLSAYAFSRIDTDEIDFGIGVGVIGEEKYVRKNASGIGEDFFGVDELDVPFFNVKKIVLAGNAQVKEGVFDGTSLEEICYYGTEAQWKNSGLSEAFDWTSFDHEVKITYMYVSVDGSAEDGQKLEAVIHGADSYGSDVSYLWFADGEPIEGETGRSYTPSLEYAGKKISVAVSCSGKRRLYSTNIVKAAEPVTINVIDEKGTGETVSVFANTRYTLSASNTEDFLYWVNGANAIVSTSPEYTFVVSTDETYKAVYKIKAEDTVRISFVSAYGQIIGEIYNVTETDVNKVVFPDFPFRNGYTAIGWNYNSDTLASKVSELLAAGTDTAAEIVVECEYELIPETVNVVVNGGAGSGEYEIQELITVTADEPEAGQRFSHWKNEKDDVVSYNNSFSFKASADTQLTAVFAKYDEVIEKNGVTVIVDTIVNDTDKKISFVSLATVPEGWEIVKAGIVATSDADKANQLTTANADYIRGNGTDVTSYRYTWTKTKVDADATWFVRGLLVFCDEEGNQFTVYSDLVSASLNS